MSDRDQDTARNCSYCGQEASTYATLGPYKVHLCNRPACTQLYLEELRIWEEENRDD